MAKSDRDYAEIGERVWRAMEKLNSKRRAEAIALRGAISLAMALWTGPKAPSASQIRERLPHPWRPGASTVRRHLAAIRANRRN